MFSKILIANRGEIAVRIIRACREMGISTVAIYSTADKEAIHVQLADESYCVGGARVADSYLNMPAILTAAVASGAQAIHPGYGLLSENAKFVKLCEECNIDFIGPTSEMINLLGDKDMARKTMREAGVPVTPGTDVLEDVESAKVLADEVGYPLLIKARSGGGGRGIRLVNTAEEFENAYNSAFAEAESAFGDGALYIEKFLNPVKHIEMQLLCDKHGNAICLGERECSVQRHNQKLIEESPSPAINAKLREKIGALNLARNTQGYDRGGYQGGSRRWLQFGRHCGVPLRQGRKFLFYGNEHPSPGGTRRFRDGYGNGYRAVANQNGGGNRAQPNSGQRLYPRSRYRVPNQRRGPR